LKNGKFREAYIQKFPYVIIYEITDNEVVVFAVSTLIKTQLKSHKLFEKTQ